MKRKPSTSDETQSKKMREILDTFDSLNRANHDSDSDCESDAGSISSLDSDDLITLDGDHTNPSMPPGDTDKEDGEFSQTSKEEGEFSQTGKEDGELSQTQSQSPSAVFPIFVPSDLLNRVLDSVLVMQDKLDSLTSEVKTTNTELLSVQEKLGDLTSEVQTLKKTNTKVKTQVKKQAYVIEKLCTHLNKVNKKKKNHSVESHHRDPEVHSDSGMDLNEVLITPDTLPTEKRKDAQERKNIVVPTWRKMYFRRRDEYRREYRNAQKAETYKIYETLRFLPRKFRPKHARTAEEFKIKEAAAFKSMDAAREVCLLDSKQSHWNYIAVESEVKQTISARSEDDDEKNSLIMLWENEISAAEPKGKSLCENEINWMRNLPDTDPYLGFFGLSIATTSDDRHQTQIPEQQPQLRDNQTINHFQNHHPQIPRTGDPVYDHPAFIENALYTRRSYNNTNTGAPQRRPQYNNTNVEAPQHRPQHNNKPSGHRYQGKQQHRNRDTYERYNNPHFQ